MTSKGSDDCEAEIVLRPSQLREIAGNLYSGALPILNSAIVNYRDSRSEAERAAHEISLSAAFFLFEVAVAWNGVALASEHPWAWKLVLKDIAHKLYEYESMLSSHYLRKLQAVADALSVQLPAELARQARRDIAPALKIIKTYKDVRNVAGGHTDPDIRKMITALDTLDAVEVRDASAAMAQFISRVLQCSLEMVKQYRAANPNMQAAIDGKPSNSAA